LVSWIEKRSLEQAVGFEKKRRGCLGLGIEENRHASASVADTQFGADGTQ
jgi:hypothetical protein